MGLSKDHTGAGYTRIILDDDGNPEMRMRSAIKPALETARLA